MKAVELVGYNGLDSLRIIEIDRPNPRDHEVVIDLEQRTIIGNESKSIIILLINDDAAGPFNTERRRQWQGSRPIKIYFGIYLYIRCRSAPVCTPIVFRQ